MGITALQSFQTAVWEMRGSSTRSLLNGLSGLHTPSRRSGGGRTGEIFSADFLYRVYDAKALSRQIVGNYFDKRDAAAAEANPVPPKPREDHKTFIDELMESTKSEPTDSTQASPAGDNLDIVA